MPPHDNSKSNISVMLNGNEYFTVIPYEAEEDIYTSVDKILNETNNRRTLTLIVYHLSVFRLFPPQLIDIQS